MEIMERWDLFELIEAETKVVLFIQVYRQFKKQKTKKRHPHSSIMRGALDWKPCKMAIVIYASPYSTNVVIFVTGTKKKPMWH